jgi:hypothetical protein
MGEVYEGIDLSLKAHGNNVEKLFTVKPGADPEQIRISLSGVKECGMQNAECGIIEEPKSKTQNQKLQINHDGELVAETELGPVKFTKPVAYQEIDGKRVEVAPKIRDSATNSCSKVILIKSVVIRERELKIYKKICPVIGIIYFDRVPK